MSEPKQGNSAKDTKNLLGDVLVERLGEKPLSKITVGEVARVAGVSRMTFYYHFKDMHDLVNWVIARFVDSLFDGIGGQVTWRGVLERMFEALHEHRATIENIAAYTGLQGFENAVKLRLHDVVRSDLQRGVGKRQVAESDLEFMADFYLNALSGTVFDWAQAGMRVDDVAGIIERIDTFLQASYESVIKAFGK